MGEGCAGRAESIWVTIKLFVTEQSPLWSPTQCQRGTNQHIRKFSLPEEFCMRHCTVSLSKCYFRKKKENQKTKPTTTTKKNPKNQQKTPYQNKATPKHKTKSPQNQKNPTNQPIKTPNNKKPKNKNKETKTSTTQNHYNPKIPSYGFW